MQEKDEIVIPNVNIAPYNTYPIFLNPGVTFYSSSTLVSQLYLIITSKD
jgi:hypothetical protein